MISQLLTPEYLPFTIAFVVMIGIGLIEAIGLGLGLGLGQFDLDGDMGGEGGRLTGRGLNRVMTSPYRGSASVGTSLAVGIPPSHLQRRGWLFHPSGE